MELEIDVGVHYWNFDISRFIEFILLIFIITDSSLASTRMFMGMSLVMSTSRQFGSRMGVNMSACSRIGPEKQGMLHASIFMVSLSAQEEREEIVIVSCEHIIWLATQETADVNKYAFLLSPYIILQMT